MGSFKNIIAGATLGTLLGSLVVALYPKREIIFETLKDGSSSFNKKAKEYADLWLTGGKELSRRRFEQRNTSLKLGLLGILVGAGATLFLTPKTGKQIRSQVTKAYNNLSGRTESVVEMIKNNSHNPFVNGVKKKKRTATAKANH